MAPEQPDWSWYVVHAEAVGDHIDGGRHQHVGGGGAHDHQVDRLGAQTGPGQGPLGGGGRQVGQRAVALTGRQIGRQMPRPRADERVHPLFP